MNSARLSQRSGCSHYDLPHPDFDLLQSAREGVLGAFAVSWVDSCSSVDPGVSRVVQREGIGMRLGDFAFADFLAVDKQGCRTARTTRPTLAVVIKRNLE